MSSTELTEEKKMIEAAKADLTLFKPLYKKYVKAVFRYSYHRLGKNRDMAEDITSETFVKAIEKFHSYEPREKPFVVWLYTIAHNLIVDYYRSKRSKNVSFDALVIPPTEETDSIIDELSRDDLKKRIDEKREELPDDLSHIFTLHLTENLTFKEIAKLIGRTEGAVKMQYYRGLDILKGLVLQT